MTIALPRRASCLRRISSMACLSTLPGNTRSISPSQGAPSMCARVPGSVTGANLDSPRGYHPLHVPAGYERGRVDHADGDVASHAAADCGDLRLNLAISPAVAAFGCRGRGSLLVRPILCKSSCMPRSTYSNLGRQSLK